MKPSLVFVQVPNDAVRHLVMEGTEDAQPVMAIDDLKLALFSGMWPHRQRLIPTRSLDVPPQFLKRLRSHEIAVLWVCHQ